MSLKENLLALNLLVDNEYLDKYCDLIESNKETQRQIHKTQRHHIIPKCYYKKLNLKIDESDGNKVNLLYKDHILAHCYLSLCSRESWFSYFNLISIRRIFGAFKQMNDEQYEKIVESLNEVQLAYEKCKELNYEFNPMFDVNKKQKHDEIMRSNEVRQKIADTMRKKCLNGEVFGEEHRRHLKEAARARMDSGNIGGVLGLKMMYDNLGKRRYVSPDKVDYHLALGWFLPVNRKKSKDKAPVGQIIKYTRRKSQEEVHDNLSKSHIGKSRNNLGKHLSSETRKKLSTALKGTKWMNNGEIQQLVKSENINHYLREGFTYGKLKKH